MLAEVKKHSEKRVPSLDMDALARAFESVCALQLESASTPDHENTIRILLDFLKVFGNLDDRYTHNQQEERLKFQESIAKLVAWSQANFTPNLPEMNAKLLRMLKEGSPEEANTMLERADKFKTVNLKLPDEYNNQFLMQCSMAS